MITEEHIQELLNNSEIAAIKMGDKTTVVKCVLPNGFVLIDSSSCIDPNNYDHSIGMKLCMNRIRDHLWELEGYLAQQRLCEDEQYKKSLPEDDLPF